MGIILELDEAEIARRKESWSIFKYQPMRPTEDRPHTNDQWGFHQDPSLVRVIEGANRGGKTICLTAEIAALMHGPPYPDWFAWGKSSTCPKPPVVVWLFMPIFPKLASSDARLRKLFFGFNSIDPYSKGELWTPPFIPDECLRNPKLLHSPDPQVFEHKNGSVLSLKSDHQDTRALASEEVHLIALDEPASNAGFYEIVPRLKTHRGSRMIYGMTNTADDGMTDHLDTVRKSPNCKIFVFGRGGNIHEDVDHSANVMELLPEEERLVREDGKSKAEVLRCYPDVFLHRRRNFLGEYEGDEVLNPWGGHGNFIPKPMCFEIPKNWTRYVVHDPGTTNPSATVWFAVEPGTEDIYAYRCLFFENPPVDTDDVVRPIFEMSVGERIVNWSMDPRGGTFPQKTCGAKQLKGRRLIDFYNMSSSRILGRKFYWSLAPSRMWAIGKTARIVALAAYLNPFNKSVPNFWIFDDGTHGMDKVKFEFGKYRKSRVKDGKSNNPEYAVAKNDNSIYCCEVAANVGFRYIPVTDDLPVMGPIKYRQRPITEEMDRFMEGGSAPPGEWI